MSAYIPIRIPCNVGTCDCCRRKSATFYEHPLEKDEMIYKACDECWEALDNYCDH